MAFTSLLRTPLGIAVVAYVVVVLGVAIAAFLLNVPLFLVLGGALLAAAVGFWFLTRRDPIASERPAGKSPEN